MLILEKLLNLCRNFFSFNMHLTFITSLFPGVNKEMEVPHLAR